MKSVNELIHVWGMTGDEDSVEECIKKYPILEKAIVAAQWARESDAALSEHPILAEKVIWASQIIDEMDGAYGGCNRQGVNESKGFPFLSIVYMISHPGFLLSAQVLRTIKSFLPSEATIDGQRLEISPSGAIYKVSFSRYVGLIRIRRQLIISGEPDKGLGFPMEVLLRSPDDWQHGVEFTPRSIVIEEDEWAEGVENSGSDAWNRDRLSEWVRANS